MVAGTAAVQLGVATDRRERRPQLVRHVGREPAQPSSEARRAANDSSMRSSIVVQGGPSRPSSVLGARYSMRCALARLAGSAMPAVASMRRSGRSPRPMSHHATAGHAEDGRAMVTTSR